jgi:hypothetical protein
VQQLPHTLVIVVPFVVILLILSASNLIVKPRTKCNRHCVVWKQHTRLCPFSDAKSSLWVSLVCYVNTDQNGGLNIPKCLYQGDACVGKSALAQVFQSGGLTYPKAYLMVMLLSF